MRKLERIMREWEIERKMNNNNNKIYNQAISFRYLKCNASDLTKNAHLVVILKMFLTDSLDFDIKFNARGSENKTHLYRRNFVKMLHKRIALSTVYIYKHRSKTQSINSLKECTVHMRNEKQDHTNPVFIFNTLFVVLFLYGLPFLLFCLSVFKTIPIIAIHHFSNFWKFF